jgi:hypothetical protein
VGDIQALMQTVLNTPGHPDSDAATDFFSSSLKRCQRKKPQKLANPARPLIFWPLKTDSDRLASRPQFNKFLGHCLVSRVARVI